MFALTDEIDLVIKYYIILIPIFYGKIIPIVMENLLFLSIFEL